MVLVEEVPKNAPSGSTNLVYFSSAYNLPPRSQAFDYIGGQNFDNEDKNKKQKRAKSVNYNISALIAKAHQQNSDDEDDIGYGDQVLTTKQMGQERASNKRFQELDRENFNETTAKGKLDSLRGGIWDGIQNITVTHDGKKVKVGLTANTRRILGSRKNVSNYLDEADDRFHKVLKSLEVPFDYSNQARYKWKKLCTICGDNAPSSCTKCGARYCSAKCGLTHDETRCSNYVG